LLLMVSVAFAMRPSPQLLERDPGSINSPARAQSLCASASFAASDVPILTARCRRFGFDIAWQSVQGRICMMSMLYQAYQNHMDLTEPWRSGSASALRYLNLVPKGVSDRLFTRLAAALELISRSSLTYTRPAYGIDRVKVGNRELEVQEEVVYATPFGSM